MCRNTLSVGWDGRLYDCDFNQMLELELGLPAGPHMRDFDEAAWARRAHRHRASLLRLHRRRRQLLRRTDLN